MAAIMALLGGGGAAAAGGTAGVATGASAATAAELSSLAGGGLMSAAAPVAYAGGSLPAIAGSAGAGAGGVPVNLGALISGKGEAGLGGFGQGFQSSNPIVEILNQIKAGKFDPARLGGAFVGQKARESEGFNFLSNAVSSFGTASRLASGPSGSKGLSSFLDDILSKTEGATLPSGSLNRASGRSSK